MIRVSIIGVILMMLGLIWFWKSETPEAKTISKINGASLVAPPQPYDSSEFSQLVNLGVDWVAIIPFGFTRQEDPRVHFNHPRQWWGERVDGIAKQVLDAKSLGMKTMLKPHVWVLGQGWPGDFDLDNESDWQVWEETYWDYIMYQARMADSLDVDLFSIGTEYRQAANKRLDFWLSLIAEVRSVYDGQITYAANWDNYQNVQFWEDLDFIGIDGYFPLNASEEPDLKELVSAWDSVRNELEDFSSAQDRQIIFTEYGYQSVKGTTGKHWEISDKELDVNAQYLAYKAFYQSFWSEEWVAGGFFWKWHLTGDIGGAEDTNYTPQGKPVEKVIRKYYSK